MNKSYFRFAILMLFFPVTGLVHAQETCSLGGNAGAVWGSLQEEIADKFSDMDSLSHAQNATNSCFDATGCDPFSIGKCLEVLDCVGQGIPTEGLSEERKKHLETIHSQTVFVDSFAMTTVADNIIGSEPPVEGVNGCTARIAYLPHGEDEPAPIPASLGAGWHRFVEIYPPTDASREWSLTGNIAGSSGKWGGGDVVGTFRIPNLLPVRLSI